MSSGRPSWTTINSGTTGSSKTTKPVGADKGFKLLSGILGG